MHGLFGEGFSGPIARGSKEIGNLLPSQRCEPETLVVVDVLLRLFRILSDFFFDIVIGFGQSSIIIKRFDQFGTDTFQSSSNIICLGGLRIKIGFQALNLSGIRLNPVR